MVKSNIEKSSDFIGWKSKDGKLEVVGIHGKQCGVVNFKVVCAECSKDPELFPDNYFISTKRNLIKGKKPCGCSKQPRWLPFQYLILARRKAKDRFIVHGLNEEFRGKNTKLDLECLKDGYKWTASIHSVTTVGTGCPKCGGKLKQTEREALQRCVDICKELDYTVIGFIDGYKNCYSYFEYSCKIHGKQKIRYTNFVNTGSRCISCSVNGYSPTKQGTLYVYQWTKENHSFIKVGITNRCLSTRIKEQSNYTLYKHKKIWSAMFEDGSIPLYIENYIKNSGIEIGVICKEDFSDGFTETTYTDNLSRLESLIVEALCLFDIQNKT